MRYSFNGGTSSPFRKTLLVDFGSISPCDVQIGKTNLLDEPVNGVLDVPFAVSLVVPPLDFFVSLPDAGLPRFVLEKSVA
jgi:hypothetical protein